MKVKFNAADGRTITAESHHAKYTIRKAEGSEEWTATIEPYWDKIELSGTLPEMVRAAQNIDEVMSQWGGHLELRA